MRHAHYKPDLVKNPDMNKLEKSLQQLVSKAENVIDAHGKADEEFKDSRDEHVFTGKMKIVTGGWCQSYLDIEQVLVALLAVYGITVDPLQEDDTENSFHLRVLQMFDNAQNPLNELLGHRDGVLPIAGFPWSKTCKEAIDKDTAKRSRNKTRDYIDCLRMFKEWWPTSDDSSKPAPEFLGLKIAPPENYGKWFTHVLTALVAAMEICTRQEVANLKRDSQNVIRSPWPETLRLRQEVANLERDLQAAIGERDIARADASRYLMQRDDAINHYEDSKAEIDERIMNAVNGAAEEVWTQVRRGLRSDELYECVRGISRRGT